MQHRASVQPGCGAATGTARTVAGGSRAEYRGDKAAVGQGAAGKALRTIGPWLQREARMRVGRRVAA